AYYFVLSLAVLDVQLLRRQTIDMPALRAVGWIASLLGATTIAAMAFPWVSPGPVIGPGGYLGALGKSVVEMHFATIGGLILSGSVALGGLLLGTDYALLRAAIYCVQVARRRRSLGSAVAMAAGGRGASKKKATDLDQGLPGDATGVKVKLNGKVQTSAAVGNAIEDEEDDEDADGAMTLK